MNDLTGESVKDLRKSLNLSQFAFWKVIGVSQSDGSKYECGRKIPKSVRILLRMKYAKLSLEKSVKLELSLRDIFKLSTLGTRL